MSGATVPAPGQPGAPVTFEGRRWRPGLSFHIKRHALTDIGSELGEPGGPWRRPQGARERRRLAVAGHPEHRAERQPKQPADHRERPLARPVSEALRPASRPGHEPAHWLACRAAYRPVTTAVASGHEALAWLQENPCDCIVLDLGLTDMSGFELLDHMKRSPTSGCSPNNASPFA